jgi:hypothetical protein
MDAHDSNPARNRLVIANQTRVGREAFLAGRATKQKSLQIGTIAAD